MENHQNGNFTIVTCHHCTCFCQKKEKLLKGIVKRAELNKCDIRLISRILWHMRIAPSLKEWRIWHCILTGNFLPLFLLISVCNTIPVKATYFHQKKLWRWVLEANKKHVSLKSYSLKIRIDSINQMWRNKEKVK